MTPIEALREGLLARFPNIDADFDPPAQESGSWFLDIRPTPACPLIVVEWRQGRGFGISVSDGSDFGLPADEVILDPTAALDRVTRLVAAHLAMNPTPALR